MITFYDLNELIEELKKEKVNIVRTEKVTKKIHNLNGFEIIITAKKKEIYKYMEEIGIVGDNETRRLNKMNGNSAVREIELKKILEKEGFEVRKGVYENVE